MKLPVIQKIFNEKKTYLFDLDGTLYLGTKGIDGARQLLERLQKNKKEVFYFTNNSSFSEKDYEKKLKSFQFPVRSKQIIISTHSLIQGLRHQNFKKLFVLGTPAMKGMLKKAKFKILPTPNSADCLVVGFDKTLTYKKLEAACFAVASGLPYFAAHPDLFCPTAKGPQPDCGAFTKAIELTTGISPKEVFGKPSRRMIDEVRQRSQSKTREMILIGDRVRTDIQMAVSAEIDSILVLSGDSSVEDLELSGLKCLGVVSSVKQLIPISEHA